MSGNQKAKTIISINKIPFKYYRNADNEEIMYTPEKARFKSGVRGCLNCMGLLT